MTHLTGSSLLEMRGVVKQFGGVHALRGVDLAVAGGEVMALLGENGAGKSTLMNILSGVLPLDAGTIAIGGEVIHLGSPATARAAGVGMIHQELDLVGQGTVVDNLYLGRERRTRWGLLDRAGMQRDAAALLANVGVDLPIARPVGSLRVGEQQMVAIARALSLDARILVMDEPTSALSDTEVDRLFAVMPSLRERGVAVIFISHRMDEIAHVADRATVMRDGANVGTVVVSETDPAEVIRMMIGQPVERLFPEHRSATQTPRLTVRGLSVGHPGESPGRSEPQNVDLVVHAGEVVGLAGLLGAGRTELLEALFGLSGPVRGTIELDGAAVELRSPRAAIQAGIGYVPEDRRASGLVMDESVGANVLLAALDQLSRGGWRRRAAEQNAVQQSVDELRIKTASADVTVGTLSGGNQQKVVFARQLLRQPRLLLLDEPTRGVDIGAKSEIYALLARLAQDGLAVLMASSEIPELLGVCDRIAVLRGGRVITVLDRDGADQESILAAASLAGRDDPQPSAEAS